MAPVLTTTEHLYTFRFYTEGESNPYVFKGIRMCFGRSRSWRDEIQHRPEPTFVCRWRWDSSHNTGIQSPLYERPFPRNGAKKIPAAAGREIG
jgi:hypothetical protein